MTVASNGGSVQSPCTTDAGSPTADSVVALQPGNNDKVQMKKQLGLIEGVAIILGVIFGSGKLLSRALTNLML